MIYVYTIQRKHKIGRQKEKKKANTTLHYNNYKLLIYWLSQTTNLCITVSQKKLCQCYFLNNFVKHWPTLIIFGTQHHEESRHKWL